MGAPLVTSVIALVLAAGQSQRFGSDKRRALMTDGTPLLLAALQQAQGCFARVCVVLPDSDDPQALGVPPGVQVIRCNDAELGMGHSLAAGVRALQAEPAQAIGVFLGDMPWIKPDTLYLLSAHASEQHIVFPLEQGQRGHPVLFGRDIWPQLAQLSGDCGAKDVLDAHTQACIAVPVDDPGVLRDVDTPAALHG